MLCLKMEETGKKCVGSVQGMCAAHRQPLGCELVYQDRDCKAPDRTRRAAVSMEGRRDYWQHP